MKKKVLIVNNTLGEGGAEKVLIDILNRFNYDKFQVKLLILNKKGMRFKDVNKNVKLRCLYPDWKFKSKFANKIWNFFKYRSIEYFYSIIYRLYAGMKNDIEIAFLEGDPTKFVSQSLNKKSKKIAWVHTDLSKSRSKEVNDEFKSVYETFDKIVCVSNSSKVAFLNYYQNMGDKVITIYNMIEIEKVRTLSNEILDIKYNKPTIVSVGRLTKLKRFDLLIKAHKNLLDKGISNEVIILGIGEEEENLKKLISIKGVEDTVKMLGYKDNPYPYIKNGDIFVVTSDFEGFSLVIAEAVCLGKVIVSTKNGGANEILCNDKYGKLVELGNEGELTNALGEVLLDDDKRRYYEKSVQERCKIFKPTRVMNEINTLLENK